MCPNLQSHSDLEEDRTRNQPSAGEIDAFQRLVRDLSDILGPSSGIDSADVDPGSLQRRMEAYQSNKAEWSRYALGDPSRPYTRNLVDEGNGKSNLLILVWSPGKGSPIHDHANAHCIMKVLHGSLKETLYDLPKGEDMHGKPKAPLCPKKETIYHENEVTYMSDNLGVHKISNPDPYGYAISLHLYTPPHAATFGFHMFEESTGHVVHVRQCHFFSRQGQKL